MFLYFPRISSPQPIVLTFAIRFHFLQIASWIRPSQSWLRLSHERKNYNFPLRDMTERSNFLGGIKFLPVAKRVQLIFFLKLMPEITIQEAVEGNEKIFRGLCSNNFSPMKPLYTRIAQIRVISQRCQNFYPKKQMYHKYILRFSNGKRYVSCIN